MTENKPARSRMTVEVTPAERVALDADVASEGSSNHDITIESLAIRRSLKLLQKAGLNVVLEDEGAEEVLSMPMDLFITFLKGDLRIVEHFVRKNQ